MTASVHERLRNPGALTDSVMLMRDDSGSCTENIRWDILLAPDNYTVTIGYGDTQFETLTAGCLLGGQAAGVGPVDPGTSAKEFSVELDLADGRLTFEGDWTTCRSVTYIKIRSAAASYASIKCASGSGLRPCDFRKSLMSIKNKKNL